MKPSPEDATVGFVAPAATNAQLKRVLIIGDGDATRQPIVEQLQQAGYDVRPLPNDSVSLTSVRGFAPDLVIIDVQQPESGGLQAAYRVRAVTSVPILILGSQSHRVDRLIGRDEYLSKPFRTPDILRRIQTLLGEDEAAAKTAASDTVVPPLSEDLRFDDLVIRPQLRVVERNGDAIALTATEFDLLFLLASHPQQVFARQKLLAWVWRYEDFSDARTVTVHMSRLRKKVEADPANPRHLRTVRSVGYKFMP